MSRWRELESLDLVAVLSARLGHERGRDLRELAPTHLTLPSGRKARLDYRTENPPTLRVKLQAMFGCRRTPTVARGRVPVQVHLLSPADRPLAVTADLASFWENAYPEVRKDMRGRYPKHDWPEHP
jgi:ATP-dependent helicase HrpB